MFLSIIQSQQILTFDNLTFGAGDQVPSFEIVCVGKKQNKILEIERNCKNTDFDGNLSLLAIANVSLELNKTGWTYLDVHANPDAPPMWQMKAIGYLEGSLWYQQLYDHNTNLQAWYLYDYLAPYTEFPEEIYQFYEANLEYLKENVYNNNDKYWNQVSYTLQHFYGLVQGYQQATINHPEMYMSELDIFIYLASGDLLDVSSFAVSMLRNRPEELHDLKISDHCSGLVKITEDDVFAGQSAWFFLTAMIRVRKHYHFDLETNVTSMLFSSYPGFSYSFDDFVVTDDLVYLETTNDIYDSQIYDLCSYKSVPAFIRSQVAGRLSYFQPNTFAVEISKYNSGTYNNQWIAINNNNNEIYVLEQIPGLCGIYNATERLQRDQYFPSFNIPSMEEIWQISGYAKHAATNNTDRYETNPRALIYQRDQGNITDYDGFKEIMRYNDYLNDPFSNTPNGPEPGNAIASRYDLRTDDTARCFGCFSTSTSHFNRKTQTYENSFISSPPYEDVPPFMIKEDQDKGLFCPSQGLIQDQYYEHEFVSAEFLN